MLSTDFDDLLGYDAPAPIGHNNPPDDRSEKAIQNDTLVELWRVFLPLGCFWWRENTGQAWQGKKIKHDKDILVLGDAHPVKFGLEGIADIMGHCRGVAIAIEMKDAKGKQRTAQKNFEAAWTKGGGVYILARTVQEAIAGVRRALTQKLNALQ